MIMTVHTARIVRVCINGDGTPSSQIERYQLDKNLENYQRYTVEGLFDWASTTLLNPFIHARYDPNLGYPNVISGGFLEYGGTQVVNFRVLSASDFNIPPLLDLTCIS